MGQGNGGVGFSFIGPSLMPALLVDPNDGIVGSWSTRSRGLVASSDSSFSIRVTEYIGRRLSATAFGGIVCSG